MTTKDTEKAKRAASDEFLASVEAILERYDATASDAERALCMSPGYLSRLRGGRRVATTGFLLTFGPYVLVEVLEGRMDNPPKRPRWLVNALKEHR